MFKRLSVVIVILLFAGVSVFAVVDSASVVNTVNTVGQIATGIATSQGNTLLAVIITAAVNVFTTIFGLVWHAKVTKKP
jgi:hypothetical protein